MGRDAGHGRGGGGVGSAPLRPLDGVQRTCTVPGGERDPDQLGVVGDVARQAGQAVARLVVADRDVGQGPRRVAMGGRL